MSLTEIENQDYRRDILSLLHGDSDYEMSEISLSSAMKAFGNPIARDRLKTNLSWLAEQGLITLSNVAGNNFMVAKITVRGADVAQGLVTVPGIARIPLD